MLLDGLFSPLISFPQDGVVSVRHWCSKHHCCISVHNKTLIHFVYLKIYCLSELTDPDGLLLKAVVPRGYCVLAESLSLSLLLLLSVTVILEPFVSSLNI